MNHFLSRRVDHLVHSKFDEILSSGPPFITEVIPQVTIALRSEILRPSRVTAPWLIVHGFIK